MKRLLGLLLVMGMVGCGGGDEDPPAGETALPATPENAQAKVDELPVQAIDVDPAAALEELGAKISRDEHGEIVAVELENLLQRMKVTDTDLVHLRELTNLKDLNLFGCQNITGAVLAYLKGLPKLESLNLFSTNVTDAGLVHLKGLTNLQDLTLIGTKITDSGLVHLAGMNLKTLSISSEAKTDIALKHYLAAVEPKSKLDLSQKSGWKITDEGLVHLKGLTNLQWLSLTDTQITDAGLVHLKDLTNLTTLYLPKQITDAGLVHLKGLTNLEELDLSGTQITDAGLVHLKGFTNLQTLLIAGTEVTDAGIAELQKALPNCTIHRNYPRRPSSRRCGSEKPRVLSSDCASK